MILAGDVGGTKINLAICEKEGDGFRIVYEGTLASREFPSLAAAVEQFRKDASQATRINSIEAACFGIAGPVVRQTVRTTNLPWQISAEELAATTGIRKVRLLNDLEATAEGLATLPAESVAALQDAPEEAGSTRALIAAGTGLGEAILICEQGIYRPVPSEGGHADFAPRNEAEIKLLEFLWQKWPHASYERALSGPGLVNLYHFLLASGEQETSGVRARLEAAGDPAAVISTLGLMNVCPVCRKALEMFVGIYGAEAGNLALKARATGGLYVGGGIAPRIRAMLTEELFLEPFRDKGRMRHLMENIPVRLVLEPKTALFGAAETALRLLAEDVQSAGVSLT
ncbi:MAG TPA: glucokinase [Acidobacteriota bacterium]|nr:glucokinase [Acidobacteriota bacterium]HRR57811.1 glucokinase [Acidobacteriota bacterium]HRV07995.1 glucokinase [Acidobacteriota bacterium]